MTPSSILPPARWALEEWVQAEWETIMEKTALSCSAIEEAS